MTEPILTEDKGIDQTQQKNVSSLPKNEPVESPSVLAISNLRCPSPPPILQHKKTDYISDEGSIATGELDDVSSLDTARGANYSSNGTMAAQIARNKVKDLNNNTSSLDAQLQLLELQSPAQPTHQRSTSVHAHFFIDESLKHGNPRSRSGSTSNNTNENILRNIFESKQSFEPRSNSNSNSNWNSNAPAQSPITGTSSALNSISIGIGSTPSYVVSKLQQDDGKLHVLFGACGSVSIKKTKMIINKLEDIYKDKISIQLILTESAEKFISKGEFSPNIQIWRDVDEWSSWKVRSDPVLHIELRKWADILIIAPLTANTLSKIALGLCDNLLTNVVRAWNSQYPILLAPAMVSFAYMSPVTKRHARVIKEQMKWIEILKPTEKVVSSYGEIGMGGMMDWNEIVVSIVNKLGGYSEIDDEDDEGDDNDGDNNDNQLDEDEDEDDEDKDGNQSKGQDENKDKVNIEAVITKRNSSKLHSAGLVPEVVLPEALSLKSDRNKNNTETFDMK